MGSEENTINSLVERGFISSAFGIQLLKHKEDSPTIGAVLNAAFSATYIAHQNARKTNIPVYCKENNKLYAIQPDGNKFFVKDLPKSNIKVPLHFKLK